MRLRIRISFFVAVLSAGALLVACGAQQSETVEQTLPTSTAVPTEKVAATPSSALPTSTAVPTKQAVATEPTATPQPTTKPTTTSEAAKPTVAPSTTASGPVIELKIADVPTTLPDYNRDDWKHWIDEDKDCQNARHEVLIEESLTDVKFKDERECQVASGRWDDPYTGNTLTDATKLDVDHMVPLKNAHDSGGWAWDKKRKSEYANHMLYEDHLIAVTASENRKKGAKGPDKWKPSNKAHWCDYATDWIEIKVEWGLSATQSEWDALVEMIGTCEQSISITPVPSQMNVPTPKPVPTKPVESPKAETSQEMQITSLDCKAKPETIVITNQGDSQQNMTGWSMTDEGTKHTFKFPDGFMLGAGLSVEVVSGTLGDNSASTIYWKKQTVWNNDGDTATVLDAAGKVVATMDCP